MKRDECSVSREAMIPEIGTRLSKVKEINMEVTEKELVFEYPESKTGKVGIVLPKDTIFYKKVRAIHPGAYNIKNPDYALLCLEATEPGVMPLSGNTLSQVRFPSANVISCQYIGKNNRILYRKIGRGVKFISAYYTVTGQTSYFDGFEYRVGSTVYAENYDSSPSNICAGGIHGFLHSNYALVY